jgi:hypothetical protein
VSALPIPRRFTLSERRQPWKRPTIRVKPEGECSFASETLIRVIEEEPVLDLLERSIRLLDSDGIIRGEVEPLRALLRACGRGATR